MEKAGPVILSMFVAHKTSLKIALKKKAGLKDLADLETRLLNSDRLAGFETRLSQLELKMKEFEFSNDEDEDQEEEYDEINSQHLDDIELSVEKERRRNKTAQSSRTEEGLPERMMTGSRESGLDSLESVPRQPSNYKSRGTIGSQSKGGSNRHLLMLARDLSSANDKIDRLTLDFSIASNEIETVKGNIEALLADYASIQTISESLKKEALQMSQQNSQLQQVLEEAKQKTHQMKHEVHSALDEFRADNNKHLSRLILLEAEQGALKNESLASRKRLQKKFDESIEFLTKVNDHSEHLFKEIKQLKASLEASDNASLQEISAMKRDINYLMGPVQDYMFVKGKESEVLNEEVKRHQDLFRKLAEEYISILDVKMAPQDSTHRTSLKSEEVLRLKQENAHLRASTASPSILRHPPNTMISPTSSLRFTKANFDWTKISHRDEGSLKAMTRPRSRIDSLSNSYRDTPRRLNISIKR